MPSDHRPAQAAANVAHRRLDPSKIAYQRPQPVGMVPDIFLSGALSLETDDRHWVPQAENVWFKPLVLNVTQGFYVNLLKVQKAGVLSRHRHFGPVHAFTLKGSWHYLEHDWVAREGDYVFEPPGETHTLVVPDDADGMITLFHVTGGYSYVDPQGEALGYEDVFTKLEAARKHFDSIGLGMEYADQFVR